MSLMLVLALLLSARATLPLNDTANVLVEPRHVLCLRGAEHLDLARPDWRRTEEGLRFDSIPANGRLWFGKRAPPTLLRMELETPRAGRWWLVSEMRVPKSLEVRLGDRHLGTFGDSLPFAARPVASADLAIPLDLAAGRQTLYVKVAERRGPCEVRLHLAPDARYPAEVSAKSFRDAWVVGYMFAVFLVALYLWFVVRDRGYGWYVFYFGSALLWLCAKRGVGFQYLWPSWPWLNAGISVALAHLAVGGFVLFVVHLLRLSRHHPMQARLLRGGALFQLALSPFLLATLIHGAALPVVESLQAILPLWILGMLGWRATKGGDALARRLLWAFSPLAAGMVYGVLVEYGLFPGGAASKATVLTVAALTENTLATLLLAWEIRRRELARLDLEREFHRKVVEQSDAFARETSHELHDGVGQQAYALRLKLFASRARMPADLAGELEERLGALHEALRGASRRLHPPRLQGRGLAEVLDELCHEASSGDVATVRFEGISAPDIPEAKAIHLYRIAQEALTNALRHAEASEVVVRLRTDRGTAVLEIEDDGVGMPEPAPAGRGIGLSGVLWRAKALEGTAEFGKRPGQGTRVTVRVPLGG